MPNSALEPGELEIPLPGVVRWNPDRTLERLGPVSHAAREPFEACGPITQLDRRYPQKPLGRPARPGPPGGGP
jgi:hypothetical protein